MNKLLSQEEPVNGLAILDKIHKSEYLEVIEDPGIWKEMCEARNHVLHERPDNPELTVKYLNQIIDLSPKLLNILILHKIKKRSDYN